MLKFKKDLVKEELDFKNYDTNEINEMIEGSYTLGRIQSKEDLSFIETAEIYVLFVKFCYANYKLDYSYGYFADYIEDNIEEMIYIFKTIYFDEIYDDTEKCLAFIEKQFEETKNKENIINARDLIKEIIEELSKKYNI